MFRAFGVLSPARAVVEWLIGSRWPGGLGIIVGDRNTLGYDSCFGPPAAHLALARRGLLAFVRLRRTLPALSMVGTACRAFIFPGVVDGWYGVSRVCRFRFAFGVPKCVARFPIAFVVFELIGRGFGVSRSTMPTMWHLCNVSRVWGSVARPGGG